MSSFRPATVSSDFALVPSKWKVRWTVETLLSRRWMAMPINSARPTRHSIRTRERRCFLHVSAKITPVLLKSRSIHQDLHVRGNYLRPNFHDQIIRIYTKELEDTKKWSVGYPIHPMRSRVFSWCYPLRFPLRQVISSTAAPWTTMDVFRRQMSPCIPDMTSIWRVQILRRHMYSGKSEVLQNTSI